MGHLRFRLARELSYKLKAHRLRIVRTGQGLERPVDVPVPVIRVTIICTGRPSCQY